VTADLVEQLADYDVIGPVPGTQPFIAGFGVHAGRLFASVTITGKHAAPARTRRTRGLLLASAGAAGQASSELGWALEVSEMLRFDWVEPVPNAAAGPGLPAWLKPASLGDGSQLGWVSVEEMLRALAAPGPRSEERSS
jgi:hypothetical protein